MKSRMRRQSHWLVFLCLVWGCQLVIWAQTETTGAIQGRVYEVGTNQPLAGVVVTITSREQCFARPTRTDYLGYYFMGLLPPGGYSLSAVLLGYEIDPDATASEIPIRLSKTEIVIPPPIGLRKIGTFGTPTAGTRPNPAPELPLVQLVNTLNASRGESFGRERLWALPLAGGRAFDQLAFLVPGVAPSPPAIGNTIGPGLGAGVGTSGQFSVNGLRSRGNNFTVDGSDNNDEDIGVRRQGFTALQPQSVESLHEYQIITHLPEPQFGRNLGAQVNAVSRSGANNLHGAVYGFFTDRRLKARDPFDLTGGPSNFPLARSRDGAPILVNKVPLAPANPVGGENPYSRTQHGFSLGGPLIKNRTMLFGSFERQDVNAARESNFAVPTVAERGLFGSGDTGRKYIYSNAQGQSTAFDAYPTSAVGDSFFSLFPFSNNPRGPYNANTYTEVLQAGADAGIFAVKLDQSLTAFSHDHTFSARYNFSDDVTLLPVTGEALFSSLRALVRAQNLSFLLYSALSPRLANQARFSYGRTRLHFSQVRSNFLRDSKALPGESYLLNAPKLINGTCPTMFCTGNGAAGQPAYLSQGTLTTEEGTGMLGQMIVSGFSPVGVDVFNFPQRRVSNTFQFADTLVLNLPHHRLTAGADFRRTQLNSRVDRNFRPLAVFNGAPDITPQLGFKPYSPTGFNRGADFVAVGSPTGFFQTLAMVPDATIGLRFWQSSFFFSDQMRLTPHFTLTLGARYELNAVPHEVNRRIENTFSSLAVKSFEDEERRLFGGVSGLTQFLDGRKSIFPADKNNVASYMAFAWDPFGKGKTAVRAGYGLYYDQIPGVVISHSRSVFPSFLTLNLAGLVPTANPSANNDFFAFNPALLAAAKTLNTYDVARLGSDPVALLLHLNRFTAPVAPKPGQTTARVQTFPGGPGFVLPAADLRTPYSQHWGLTIEHEMKRDFLASLAYVGTKGVRLLRFATPNLGPNTIPVITGDRLSGFDPIFTGFAVAPGHDFKRPFPLLGSFTSIESDANSSYHSLQLQLDKRLVRGLQWSAFYVWSHAIDEVSDLFDLAGARALPQDSFDRRAERASAGFDVRHRFVANFVWDIPFFSRHRILGGWQLAGIITLQSGQPFTLLAGYDVNLDGNLTDRLNSQEGIVTVERGAERLRVAPNRALTTLLAPVGHNGAIGRNTFRAPGVAVIDIAVNKHFRFGERRDLEFRSEFFNLLNRPQYAIPVHQLDNPGFGQSVETRLPMRTVQFALRFSF